MSETVSTKLPRELVRLMEKEAEAKGMSLSMLLREIIEEHYGVKLLKPKKPFIVELQETLNALGEAKMANCLSKENCLIKDLNLNPSPLICAICQVHSHAASIKLSKLEDETGLGFREFLAYYENKIAERDKILKEIRELEERRARRVIKGYDNERLSIYLEFRRRFLE